MQISSVIGLRKYHFFTTCIYSMFLLSIAQISHCLLYIRFPAFHLGARKSGEMFVKLWLYTEITAAKWYHQSTTLYEHCVETFRLAQKHLSILGNVAENSIDRFCIILHNLFFRSGTRTLFRSRITSCVEITSAQE